jgi:antitoxin YefM
MRTTSSTDFRKNLSKVMDEVNEDHTPYIITRSKGKPIVVMSLDDYNAMDETAYLLSTSDNAKRLSDAINRLEKGEGTAYDLIEE